MIFISIIICIAIERFLSSLHTIRNFSWLESLALGVSKSASESSLLKNALLIIMIIALPATLVIIVNNQLSYIFVPLEFLFATIVLFYSLGPETFYDRMKSYCDAKDSNDEPSALWFAEIILRRNLSDEEKQQMSHTLVHNIFPIANDRMFAPIFWFCILGPTGAIIYRCVSRMEFIYSSNDKTPSGLKRAAVGLLSVLNWIPARTTALGFMMVGNFSESLRHCKSSGVNYFFSLHQNSSKELLSCVAKGAVNLPDSPTEIHHQHMKDALGLVRRNIELILGVLALLTLAGAL